MNTPVSYDHFCLPVSIISQRRLYVFRHLYLALLSGIRPTTDPIVNFLLYARNCDVAFMSVGVWCEGFKWNIFKVPVPVWISIYIHNCMLHAYYN